MSRKRHFILSVFFLLLFFVPVSVSAGPVVRICVFNFGMINIEAAGYGTDVTNMLVTALGSMASLDIMERKELETFLELNDLQVNNDFRNVIHIGRRLGLYAIVVGSVAKKGSIITIMCKVIQIDGEKIILNTGLKSIGDSGLVSKTNKLSTLIYQAVTKNISQQAEIQGRGFVRPVDIQVRPSGSNKIYLSWKVPADATAAGYKIFRSTSKDGLFSKIAQVPKTEYLDQYLETMTTYFYKIKSYDHKGRQSNFSEVVSAETAPTPSPPIILSTVPHVRSIEIIWAPSPAKSADTNKLKGYKLYRAKVEEGPYQKVATILGRDVGLGTHSTTTLDKLLKVSYVDKDLVDGESHYYKITAYNVKDLESDFSTPVKGNTITVVSDISARGDMIREIELVWGEADSPHVKGYYVYRSKDQTTGFNKIEKITKGSTVKTSTVKTEQVSFTDNQGLGDKITYYYYVTAFEDKDMETSPSVTVSATTRGKPPVVAGLQARGAMVKQVDVTWQANEQEEIKGYKLHRCKDASGTCSPIKDISGRGKSRFIDTKLNDNTNYCYRITSYNKVNVESAMSDAVCATTKPRPVKPEGLEGIGLEVKKVTLKWTSNPEVDITLYYIYRSSDDSEKYSTIAKLEKKTDYIDMDLKDGHEYLYKIMVEDKDGLQSDFSDIITVKTKSRPKNPEGLTGNSEGGKITLIWNPNSETDIDHYIIYGSDFFGLTKKKVSSVNTNKVSLPGLPPGKKKTYVVTAVDKDGLESEESQSVEILGKPN